LFLDFVKIHIKSGDGGNGCISFRREKYVPRGGPNGGDGGKGGDVIFVASSDLSTLIDFRYKQHYKAKKGAHGQGGDKTGKNGDDLYIKVPCGSIIRDSETGEILAELLNDGEKAVILKGGSGGKGNTHFKTSTNRAPRIAQSGKKGEEKTVEIELKLIADCGLVGFPNAGKSTLISAISAAKPKIADYPFTTLVPNLGIVKYKEYESFVVADIPGIIQGASDGKGLGIQFLKHIERTSILLFMIDATQIPDGSKELITQYKILLKELKNYSEKLIKKPRILCFTKIDAIDSELKERLVKYKGKIDSLAISSVTGENLEKLKTMIYKKIKEYKEQNETNNINIE